MMRYLLTLISVSALILLHSCNNGPGKTGSATGDSDDDTTLEERITGQPDNARLYNQRALKNLEQEDMNGALSDINRALQLDSANSEYFVTLSLIYRAMGKLGNSIEALDRAEELDPENTVALINRVEIYLILREYKEVFSHIEQLLDRDDFNPRAYFLRGVALLETGDTALAVRSLMTAVDQDQQFYEAYIQLGLLYAEKGDPLAEGYYKNAINASPNIPDPYYLLGLYYQEREEIDKASEVYERIITIDPGFTEAYYNLGYLNLVYIADYDEAIEYFSGAVRLRPDYPEAFYNRGYARELSGDYEGARKDYQEASRILPNYELAVKGLNRLDKLP